MLLSGQSVFKKGLIAVTALTLLELEAILPFVNVRDLLPSFVIKVILQHCKMNKYTINRRI